MVIPRKLFLDIVLSHVLYNITICHIIKPESSCKNFSKSVEVEDRNLMMMEHISLRNGGSTIGQSFKLVELFEDGYLQSLQLW